MGFLHRAVAVAFASCLLAAPASAQLVSFTFSGGLTASWTLPQHPVPDFTNSDLVAIDNVDILYDGAARNLNLEFFTAGFGGGVCIDAINACDLGDLFGEQLFTGEVETPTFRLGTFSLINGIDDSEVFLLIEQVATVPEPSAVLLLAIGAAGLLAVRRRRHRLRA